MLSDSLAQQKQELREKLRFRRRHFAANLDTMARLTAFRALPAPLADLIAASGPVAAYAASGSEPDILPMLTGKTLALPHHEGRVETMDFRRWQSGDPLVKGPWGTPQPADEAERVLPGPIFCPLVGFDRHGGRLGQGGGHYDRFFAEHPDIIRIGIAWSVQEVDTVPIEPTDAKLDAILTEQEYIVTGDRL
jgi:5-formyltetrahydrofolate cyclo-ligase